MWLRDLNHSPTTSFLHASSHRPKMTSIQVSLSLLYSVLVVAAQGFGQGTMIENSFDSTYCREGVSALSRGPVHYDLERCGGQCRARRAPREMFRLLVNSSSYAVDNVQVDLRANARQGANIRGFAVVAITEAGGTAGRWVVDEDSQEPEVLRATCDSLLEGQVIFQAQPSNERTSVTLVWNPRKTNHGTIIFRAWIVQSLDDIFVVDSLPLTNPLDGRKSMAIENHFWDLLQDMDNVNQSQKLPSPLSQRLPLPRSNAGTRGTGVGRRTLPRDRPVPTVPGVGAESPGGVTRQNSSSAEHRGGVVERDRLSMEHFEDAFLARLTTGFDLSGPDPFLDFNKEAYRLSDFIPDFRNFLKEERERGVGSEPNESSLQGNRSTPSHVNTTQTSAIPTSRNNNSNGNAGSLSSTGRGSSDPRFRRQPSSSGAGQPDPRFPFLPDGPVQTDSRNSPVLPSSPGAARLPSQVLPSPTEAQKPGTVTTIRLAPGNPFAGLRFPSGQNQNLINLQFPGRNAATVGINSNPVFVNRAFRQPLPGLLGTNEPFMSSRSSFLPGFNTQFTPQPNFNRWVPSWNARTNSGSQNGGSTSRGFVPGWNIGQNLAGWNSNLARSWGNPFRANFNSGLNRMSSQINSNRNRSPRASSPVGSNSNTVQVDQNIETLAPTVNSGSDAIAPRNTNPGSLGSFSDLLQAVGGWDRQ